MTTPSELITRFRATPDIPAFLKVCSVGVLRQLTRAYRSSHGLQESDGRTITPRRSSSLSWWRPRKTAASGAVHNAPRFRYNSRYIKSTVEQSTRENRGTNIP
jgi:hypothetical protein